MMLYPASHAGLRGVWSVTPNVTLNVTPECDPKRDPCIAYAPKCWIE